MTTQARPKVVGVFSSDAQAQQAMNDLQQAGFKNDQIRYSVRKGGGGITDSLENLGLPEEEAAFYNSEFESGRTIVTVNTNNRQQDAYDILRRAGAYDFNTRSASTSSSSSTTDTGEQDLQHIQLREEELRARKQTVQAGEVGIRKEVVTEQQTINVPTSHEEVVIERRPASGQPSDTPVGEGETYRIPVREEQVTVEKQPIVREEVSLGKRQVQETQHVTDTTRREKAHLEREGDIPIHDTKTDPFHPSQKGVDELLEES